MFWNSHVFVNVSLAFTCVLSGMVTSRKRMAAFVQFVEAEAVVPGLTVSVAGESVAVAGIQTDCRRSQGSSYKISLRDGAIRISRDGDTGIEKKRDQDRDKEFLHHGFARMSDKEGTGGAFGLRLFPAWVYLPGGVQVKIHGPWSGTDSYKLNSTVRGPVGGADENVIFSEYSTIVF